MVKKSLINYEIPKVLEAAACILSQYFRSNIHLFNDNPKTSTRCQENIRGYQVIVGNFTPDSLFTHRSEYDRIEYGVAALRKFYGDSKPSTSKGEFRSLQRL